MAITTLIRISGVTLKKLKGYTVEHNKLWADAGRNMSGDLKATFIGIFIKIDLEFTYQTGDQLRSLLTLLDQPFFTVDWWDEKTNALQSRTFYASDYKIPLFRKDTQMYEGFTVNLIATKKL